MSELTPTRGLLIALTDERKTMREGHAFLDEKCLLLAGEMLRQLKRHRVLREELAPLQETAAFTLAAALGRHGLNGLQVHPTAPANQRVRIESHSLLGVATMQSNLIDAAGPAPPAVFPSPEAQACRAAYAQVIAKLVELAAVSVSLARLRTEYRRTVRRVRALQDVLLPELDTEIANIGTVLEDLEREEAVVLRFKH